MILRKSILFVLQLILITSVCSQTKEDALRDAKITSKATLKEDYKTVLKHTLPKIVELMGGKDTALNTIESTFNKMKSEGFVFEKADILNVSEIIKEQNQFRCVIEGYNQMKMSGQRIGSKSYLLGIYDEKEKIWYFLEAKQLKNKAMLNQILPSFKTSLDIPESEMKYIPNDN
ncbi:hypothetical protein [uncultured Winogradskyella sp.]|uniref:hypothetical protein n=1 Tax=uncultured Winogradskyella sp. TaxID=395353 RepID=UPI00260EFA2E|nr:hypothetical protein [uncultured Winogradskyella sp.]